MKPEGMTYEQFLDMPAAFRRLCVETAATAEAFGLPAPAAFRRLCVETRRFAHSVARDFPAAFRRLCVETRNLVNRFSALRPSRLQAAVC